MNRTLVALHALLLAAPLAWAQSAPQRFLIERDMPGASKSSPEEFRNSAAKSNAVLRELGPDIQWVHSYVTGDKIYCVYQAPDEDMVREHARRGGFPADSVACVVRTIDPTTAEV